MSRELLVLRHAEASSDSSETDFDRPLTPRGVMSCHIVAHQLMKSEKLPDRILSSNAVRTTQTTLRVCKQARISTDIITWSPAFYNCDVSVWLDAFSEVSDDVMRLLIVGHNPAIHNLVEQLCAAPIAAPKRGSVVPAATLFELDIDAPDWRHVIAGSATLTNLTRPSSKMPVFDPDH